jgi:hypothetical protein
MSLGVVLQIYSLIIVDAGRLTATGVEAGEGDLQQDN